MLDKSPVAKRYLVTTAFFLIAIAFSLLSTIIITTVNCGSIKILNLQCGNYAGWPIPFAKFNDKAFRVADGKIIINPTIYYKYKFSPIRDDREVSHDFLADGSLMPFFLFDNTLYQFNTVLFILNTLIWLVPSGFLIGVFF